METRILLFSVSVILAGFWSYYPLECGILDHFSDFEVTIISALVVTYAVVKGSNYIWKHIRIARFSRKYQYLNIFKHFDPENDKHVYYK